MNRDCFTLEDFLPYLLNQAAEEASSSFAEVYKTRYGMLRTDWRVLFHLGLFGQMAARDIAARAREDKTRISRAVARLEGMGYLARKTDPNDRRAERLSLTASGRKVYDDLHAQAALHDAALAERLGPRATARLRQSLLKLAQG